MITTLIFIAWGHGSTSLTERFEQARVTWIHPQDPSITATSTTYQGFVKALARVGEAMIPADRLAAACRDAIDRRAVVATRRVVRLGCRRQPVRTAPHRGSRTAVVHD